MEFRTYVRKYERRIGLIAIVAGFIWDSITLGAPDSLFNNIVFVTYLILSGAIILILALYERKGTPAPALFMPLLQFSFGNLAGGLLVVYGQSGTLEGSALFFAILLVFILGNEFARSYYARLSFHVAAWYFLLFGYVAIILPIIMGRLGTGVFILSGIVSIAVVALFLFLLRSISRERVVAARPENLALIGSIFLIMNVFYFANIIPPVPLSIKSIGIYHSLERLSGGDYAVTYEQPKWYEFFRETSGTFSGASRVAYCFSSVFAPVRLSAPVHHRWEYRAPDGSWETRTLVQFPISGGREEGYRGYSVKVDLTPGKWRCSVETESGGIIGRTTFTVTGGIPSLEERRL